MQKRILLVDDDKTLREMYALSLRQAGYEVVEVARGREGLEILEKETFDLTLLDMMMPGMTGIEMISKIARNGKISNMGEVIGFTSLSKESISSRLETFKIEVCLDKSELTPAGLLMEVNKQLS